MAAITASDVNKLRKETGSGMMDCKKALVEAEGDFQKAVEILRKKGQKIAAKRGDNEASEGYVFALVNEDNTKGINMVLNCETDFVSKNDDFGKFVQSIAATALANGCKTVEEVLSSDLNGMSVQDAITDQMGKIGEKMEISNYALIEAETVVAYNHPGSSNSALVGLNVAGEDVQQAGRDVAMQISAMNPVSVSRDNVPSDVVEKELDIAKELARKEGKPEEMLDKIAQGRLNKFYKESTLLEQEFIKESKTAVKDYLKRVNPDLTVTSFKRISLS